VKKIEKIAVIGGSGVYDFQEATLIDEIEIETPYGKPSSAIKHISLNGIEFYFIARHGIGHFIAPSDINYRANIYALKTLGVDCIVSVSAVGSLKEEYAPGDFVLPDQFLDWTKGLRKRTFFEDGVVGHVSTAYPVNTDLQDIIMKASETVDVKCHQNGTYVCIEGPQFSTRSESNLYRSFGADVIGMTNVPEAFLAKEAGIAYATIAMVTDYDCWKEEHCTVEEIMKVMKQNYVSAQSVLKSLLPLLKENPFSFVPENKYAVVTNPDLISSKQNDIINTLIN
jgi:5'-methylthioadenosine phosphorylase